MKKWLLVTVALLALGSSVAMAEDAMNIAWGSCRTATNNTTLSTNDFTPVMPCDDPANDFATRRIVCSFKNNTTLLQFSGTTVGVDFQVAGGTLVDFWNFGPGGCSDGMVAGATTVLNGGNCTNPYTLAPTDPNGQTDLSNVQVDVGLARLSYVADHVRNTLPVDLPPPATTGGYTANNLALQGGYGSGSIASCAGCDVAATINLTRVAYFSLSESRSIVKAELKSCASWAGGGGLNCAGATPSVRATWGQVKALYR
jgi:hypothetical protein